MIVIGEALNFVSQQIAPAVSRMGQAIRRRWSRSATVSPERLLAAIVDDIEVGRSPIKVST